MPQTDRLSINVPEKSEMDSSDIQLLLYLLKEYRPKKILEISVSAGGTTTILLDCANCESVVHSCDISELYYRDSTKHSGYVAAEYYDKSRHPEWKRYFGKDITQCIKEVGHEIDLVLMDTVHSLPGEFLNFLAILPFLADQCVIMMHDFGRHVIHIERDMRYALDNRSVRESYGSLLLYGALHSGVKYMASARIPNSGAVCIEKSRTIDTVFPVFASLFLPWSYMPNNGILERVAATIRDMYPSGDYYARLFAKAVEYNRARFADGG